MTSATAKTVWALVDEAATGHPDRVLLRDERGRSITASELRDSAERVAAGLDVAPGDVVSWQLPTSLEAAVLMVALARVGAVQNPIIPILRDVEVRHITGRIGADVLLVPEQWSGFDHGAMARAVAADHGFDVVTVDLEREAGDELRLPTADPENLPPPPTDDDVCRWLYFTSGTTAAPKGARHSDASLIASSAGMIDGIGIAEDDVYPIAWPLTHIGGMTMLSSVLRAGGTLVLFETFGPATVGERMAAFHPTILGTGVPFFRAYLDAQRRHGDEPLFPNLRALVAGGAATPPEIIRELGDVFGVDGVLNAYGLTEFPIASSLSPDDPPEKLATTVGRPAPGVDVRVVDGEIRLSGPQQFLGYVDAGLDAAALDDDGYFRTGDLGKIDADGFVVITGRMKDVIIRNAENISALEIEDVLLRHPDVLDVAVVGLPDARTGEQVCAVIVPEADRTIDLAAVAAHCQAQGMAKQKTPERIELVQAIERNAMGKVVKSELRARVLASGDSPSSTL